MTQFADLRKRMVDEQLVARGIQDPAVLEAMSTVPREVFVPDNQVQLAYADAPLPIGEGQTISQPYIVALMSEALELSPDEQVLEIGTGSGYAAAVLSRMVRQVYTVERHSKLARAAKTRFQQIGYNNIRVHVGDGTLGWAEHAPYDGIIATAGGPKVPEPLLDQLKRGGRLVMPVGRTIQLQELVRVRRSRSDGFRQEELGSVRFVPLVGEAGWQRA